MHKPNGRSRCPPRPKATSSAKDEDRKPHNGWISEAHGNTWKYLKDPQMHFHNITILARFRSNQRIKKHVTSEKPIGRDPTQKHRNAPCKSKSQNILCFLFLFLCRFGPLGRSQWPPRRRLGRRRPCRSRRPGASGPGPWRPWGRHVGRRAHGAATRRARLGPGVVGRRLPGAHRGTRGADRRTWRRAPTHGGSG